MEDYWEENDVISKLLDQSGIDESVESLGESLSKSLHEEFEEIGENYELPVKITKRFSLQNLIDEFHQINQIVDKEIQEPFIVKSIEEKNHEKPVKAVKPPPGILEKPSMPIGFSIVGVTSSKTKQSSKSPTLKQNQKIRPPPGFSAKPVPNQQFKGFSNPEINHQSKKLTFETKTTVKPVTPSTVKPDLCKESLASLASGKNLARKSKDVKSIMCEFESLSSIMDKEIVKYETKLTGMEEQRDCLHENLKEAGRVDMLKTLLYEQQEKMKQMELNHQQQIDQLLVSHKKELDESEKELKIKHQKQMSYVLVEQQRELEEAKSLSGNSKSSNDLQIEFNKVLNQKEEEIENLNAMLHDLQYELESYQGGSDQIAMENEELCEKVQIKDDYISTLKLQLTNYEKLHAQDEWKLQQADDNLEMVERERDEIESKATAIMKRLKNDLESEREKTHKMQHYIEIIHDKCRQHISNNATSENDKQPKTLTNDKLMRSKKQEPPTNYNVNSRTIKAKEDRMQTPSPPPDGNNDELCPELKEKLAKMALRSFSKVSRASSVVTTDSVTKTSPLLKSLGWFTVESNS